MATRLAAAAVNRAKSAFGVTETLFLVTICDQVWIWGLARSRRVACRGAAADRSRAARRPIISAARLVHVRGDTACSQTFAGHDEYPYRDAAGTPLGRMRSELGGAKLCRRVPAGSVVACSRPWGLDADFVSGREDLRR